MATRIAWLSCGGAFLCRSKRRAEHVLSFPSLRRWRRFAASAMFSIGVTHFIPLNAWAQAPRGDASFVLKLPPEALSSGGSMQPLRVRVHSDSGNEIARQSVPQETTPQPANSRDRDITHKPNAAVAPKLPLPKIVDDDTVIRINTSAPTTTDLFRLDTERQFRQRIIDETKRFGDRVQIPHLPQTPTNALPIERGWPELVEPAESPRLCFFRLGFEQKRSERYGQSLGPLQPFVSVGFFYGELATWPLRIFAPPWTCMRCDDLSDLTCYPSKNGSSPWRLYD